MEKKSIPYIFIWVISALAVVVLLLKILFPLFFMLVLGKPGLVVTPSTLFIWYMIMAVLAGLLYATSSDPRFKDFLSFLHNESDSKLRNGLLIGILVIFPAIVGYITYSATATGTTSPVELRIMHPTLPGEYEKLQNPFRTAGDPEAQEQALMEGRHLFQAYCRPCHGCAADGNGPFADSFRLRPIDFTDPGTIATIIEPYAFWRVKEGAFALPSSATPWDSVMPAWKDILSDEQIWQVVMAAYDIAGVEPRQPAKQAESE